MIQRSSSVSRRMTIRGISVFAWRGTTKGFNLIGEFDLTLFHERAQAFRDAISGDPSVALEEQEADMSFTEMGPQPADDP